MRVQVETVGDVAVVTIPGDTLDASNTKAFKRDVATVLESHARVVFDMSHLRFVDSSGLGALLSCLRRLNAAGGDLKLCGVTKSVRALLQLVRMHQILDVLNTREEAIRAFET